jgi:hypothetical protein
MLWNYITIAWTAKDSLVEFRRTETLEEAQQASLDMLCTYDECERVTICKNESDTLTINSHKCSCGHHADIECKISTCEPSTWWCSDCYEKEHCPDSDAFSD